MNHTFYPPEPAEWSAWDTRELGFADSPTHIQCRSCSKVLPAQPLFYRRKRSDNGLGFQTKCRACEKHDPYRRSVAGRVALIRSDPSIPDAVKQYEASKVGDVVKQAKRKALRAARATEFDLDFKQQWTAVRKIIVYRKEKLVANITSSKQRGSGLYFHMEHSYKANNYIRGLLAVYSAIIDRMRRLDEWRATIGDHLPPSSWAYAIDQCMQARQSKPPTMPLGYVMAINPWLFTTRDERTLVRNADPELEDPIDPYWQEVITARGDSGRIKMHVYPWRYPEDAPGPAEQTPDWLRAFNGYDKQ
jgi:hypothetical protein